MLRLKSLVVVGMLAICGASLAGNAAPAPGKHVRFIVLGDDRIRFPGEGGLRKGYDNPKSGIAEGIFGPLLSDALKTRPDFVLVTGDLVGGESKDVKGLADLKDQLRAWVKLVKARNKRNVPIFAVRGNHETKGKDPEKAWKPVADYVATFSKRVNNFQTDGFNVGFNLGNVTVVGLDCYRVDKNFAETEWAKQVLKKKKQYVVAYSHPMCFFSGGHDDHIDAENRDELLNLLMKNGCTAFFAGHDHLYDRVVATRDDDKWHGAKLEQYVAGTAGAPFYQGKALPKSEKSKDDATYKLSRLAHTENQFGYLVVDVYGNSAPQVKMVIFKVPGLKDPSTMRSIR